jgi:hypothetical protein
MPLSGHYVSAQATEPLPKPLRQCPGHCASVQATTSVPKPRRTCLGHYANAQATAPVRNNKAITPVPKPVRQYLSQYASTPGHYVTRTDECGNLNVLLMAVMTLHLKKKWPKR